MKAYLTFSQSAQYYECGFSCDNAIVVRIGEERFFITDSRYTLEAKELSHSGVEVTESKDFIQSIQGIVNRFKLKKMTFDSQEMNVDFYQKLREGLETFKCSLDAQANFHQKLRIIKTKEEIDLIRQSQKLNKKAFKNFAKYLEKVLNDAPNEQELHYEAIKCLTHKGKYALSFEPIVGLNANAAKPHALPSVKCKLHKNDLLLFDAGIKYKRYCSDMTRTALIKNEISFNKDQKFKDKQRMKVYDIVRKAQENVIKNARSGMSGKQIDSLAREVIEKSGYGKYFVHSTGHGVGLDIHELPRISRISDEIVQDGMVFSVEPGIYLPNAFGVRIEDLVVMRNGRAEVL